jgi:hypothetical protein
MEKHPNPGIEMMIKARLFFWVGCLLAACGQPGSTAKKSNDSLLVDQNNIIAETKLSFDSNNIAILSNSQIRFFSLKDSLPATLSNPDMQIIEQLLSERILVHNKNIDSNNVYAGYIHSGKYKRQYIPYTGVHGEKKVFINCFCKGLDNFDYWKEKLVEVDDGGVCFFNVTINLSTQTCGPLLINGPG